jgi:hypothetical protein
MIVDNKRLNFYTGLVLGKVKMPFLICSLSKQRRGEESAERVQLLSGNVEKIVGQTHREME